jgi:glycosyltransferase 2 family protein
MLARRAYLALVVTVFAVAVVSQRDELSRLIDDARLLVLAAALLASYGQLTLTSAFWRSGLASLGEPVRYRAALLATLTSLPARYLPGSIWYAVSRVARLHREGAARSTLAAVAAVEMALVPVVGFALGALLLAVSADGPRTTAPLLAVTVVLAAASTPPAVNALLRLLRRIRPSTAPEVRLGWLGHARLVGWTAAFWLWSSGVFTLYVMAFPALDAGSPLTVAGAYMVAWGVGWLALFAPQGVGVFEVTLAALVGGGAGIAGLAVLVAGYRAVIAVRDLLAAAMAALVDRRSRTS